MPSDPSTWTTAENINFIGRILKAGVKVSRAEMRYIADRPSAERAVAWTELREAIAVERGLHLAQYLAGRSTPLPHLDAAANYRNGSALLRVAAFLDTELDDQCRSRGLRPDRSDLKHRIDAVSALLPNANELHEVRRTRNDVAHTVSTEVSGADVDHAVRQVHEALSALDDYGPPLELKAGGESISIRSDGETDDGYEILDEREIRLHVKNGDDPHLTVAWTLTFFD